MQQDIPLFKIKRRRSEIPLFILMLMVSLVLWIIFGVIAIASIIGALYILTIVLFFLFIHVAAISHIRGNGVQVNQKQFPKIHEAVEKISFAFGLKKVPEVYIIQSDGALNAMATKFARSRMVILYSSLLEACENHEGARNMIIGHELAHIRLGHLNWHNLTFFGRLFPFLGKAYSRACEYSCDRYGLAAAGNQEEALFGLTLLAIGKNLAPQVVREVMVNQLHTLNTGWMRIGEWISTHPPLIKRMCALDPNLEKDIKLFPWGTLRGIFILLLGPIFAIILWKIVNVIPDNITQNFTNILKNSFLLQKHDKTSSEATE